MTQSKQNKKKKKNPGKNKSRVYKARPSLTNQTVPKFCCANSIENGETASSQTNPTTPRCGCNPQNRRSLTVSSRRSFQARDLKRGPTFPCGGRYRCPRALRSPRRPPCSDPPRPERTEAAPELRRSVDCGACVGVAGQGEGGSARGDAPASGGGARERRGGSSREERKEADGEDERRGKEKCG